MSLNVLVGPLVVWPNPRANARRMKRFGGSSWLVGLNLKHMKRRNTIAAIFADRSLSDSPRQYNSQTMIHCPKRKSLASSAFKRYKLGTERDVAKETMQAIKSR